MVKSNKLSSPVNSRQNKASSVKKSSSIATRANPYPIQKKASTESKLKKSSFQSKAIELISTEVKCKSAQNSK